LDNSTGFNIIYPAPFFKGGTINNQDIFSIIGETTEALSLTSDPSKLLDIALDSVSRLLGADCCWIQFVTPDKELTLTASQNLPALLQKKLGKMSSTHPFAREISGMGNPVVLPYLNQDGRFDIAAFEDEGYHSLLAVPIMTYHVLGIMGAAFRHEKFFTNDDTGLLATIAGIIGMVYHKLPSAKTVNQTTPPPPEPAPKTTPVQKTTPLPSVRTAATSAKPKPAGKFLDEEHRHRMQAFRKTHRRPRKVLI
jgi:transcriptional regulator with GAF, ATPase, and Fis domain